MVAPCVVVFLSLFFSLSLWNHILAPEIHAQELHGEEKEKIELRISRVAVGVGEEPEEQRVDRAPEEARDLSLGGEHHGEHTGERGRARGAHQIATPGLNA